MSVVQFDKPDFTGIVLGALWIIRLVTVSFTVEAETHRFTNFSCLLWQQRVMEMTTMKMAEELA